MKYVQKVSRLNINFSIQRRTMNEMFILFEIVTMALNKSIPVSFALVEASLKLLFCISFNMLQSPHRDEIFPLRKEKSHS